MFCNKNDNFYSQIEQAFTSSHVPGMQVVILKNNHIAESYNFGYLNVSSKQRVTETTKFQAGSISKSIAAICLLALSKTQQLGLDVDVNKYLKSWHLNYLEYPGSYITFKQLLSMTSGVSVSSFSGYDNCRKIPTLIQILNNVPPNNSGVIEIKYKPGTTYLYSGGGYTVLEQALEDVSGKNFKTLVQESVFDPLGMMHSHYHSVMTHKNYATGYHGSGEAVTGGYRIYPELAAAGLWTTAYDLGLFASTIMQSCQNKGNFLSAIAINEVFTRQPNSFYGLGFVINLATQKECMSANKGGATLGFRSRLAIYPNSGDGVIVMTNSNSGTSLIDQIIDMVGNHYKWPSIAIMDPLS